MKRDLSKLSGHDLFEYYTSQRDNYAQILFQLHLQISDEIFKMLEEAEKESKKIAIKDSLQGVNDPPITIVIE